MSQAKNGAYGLMEKCPQSWIPSGALGNNPFPRLSQLQEGTYIPQLLEQLPLSSNYITRTSAFIITSDPSTYTLLTS